MKTNSASQNDAIIGDRNKHWVTTIEKHSSKVKFVYAGIAHLLSKDIGLIHYYESKGYIIKPIPLEISIYN